MDVPALGRNQTCGRVIRYVAVPIIVLNLPSSPLRISPDGQLPTSCQIGYASDASRPAVKHAYESRRWLCTFVVAARLTRGGQERPTCADLWCIPGESAYPLVDGFLRSMLAGSRKGDGYARGLYRGCLKQ